MRVSAEQRYLPLKGRKVYVDIRDGHKEKEMKRDVLRLGGAVEDFLAADISYVVSDDPSCSELAKLSFTGTENDNQSRPTSSTLLPGSFSRCSSSLSTGRHLKRMSIVSQEKPRKTLARLGGSTTNDQAKGKALSCVLRRAKALGINVQPFSRFRQFIDRKLQKQSEACAEAAGAGALMNNNTIPELSSLHCTVPALDEILSTLRQQQAVITETSYIVRELKQPCFKVESFRDSSWRPFYGEFDKWPSVDDYAEKVRSDNVARRAAIKRYGRAVRSKRRSLENFDPVPNRSGYCEICNVQCENLREHIETDVHNRNSSDDAFKELDAFIGKQPTLDELRQQLKRDRASIILSTPVVTAEASTSVAHLSAAERHSKAVHPENQNSEANFLSVKGNTSVLTPPVSSLANAFKADQNLELSEPISGDISDNVFSRPSGNEQLTPAVSVAELVSSDPLVGPKDTLLAVPQNTPLPVPQDTLLSPKVLSDAHPKQPQLQHLPSYEDEPTIAYFYNTNMNSVLNGGGSDGSTLPYFYDGILCTSLDLLNAPGRETYSELIRRGYEKERRRRSVCAESVTSSVNSVVF